MTRPYLSGTEPRECRLYRIRGLDPRTNYRTITLIYVGESAREPFVRFIEHLYEQPFGDTIVGHPEVDPRPFASKNDVWAAERAAIEAERPLYNIEYNLANPDRIPPWTAREQRWARDDAAGRPRWQPGERTHAATAPFASRRALVSVRHLRQRWTRRRIRSTLRTVRWVAAVLVWLVAFGLITWRVRAGGAAMGPPDPAEGRRDRRGGRTKRDLPADRVAVAPQAPTPVGAGSRG
jgi:hypothetical protein